MKIGIELFARIVMCLLVRLGKFLYPNHRRFDKYVRNCRYFVPNILGW